MLLAAAAARQNNSRRHWVLAYDDSVKNQKVPRNILKFEQDNQQSLKNKIVTWTMLERFA